MSKKKISQKMIKTSIDLTAEHYHFLKLKALSRKMRGEDPSFVTILRELIEQDKQKWETKSKLLTVILVGLLCTAFSLPAFASYLPFNTNIKMNVGIGSANPGQALDVNGTVRMTNLAMTGQSPSLGRVLTALDTNGNTTWSPAGGVSGWTITNTNDVYETFLGNVGIGTTITNSGAALTVMNGNVGIGTWVPKALLSVNGTSILGSRSSNLDSITSNGTASLAGGFAWDDSSASGSIISSSQGSIAFGRAEGAGGVNSSIIANNIASFAMGSATAGNLEATGWASIAMGNAYLGNLEATGQASVAIGQNVQATNNFSFALGLNLVNPTANSIMMGFSTTPALTVTNSTVGVGIGTYTTPSGALVVQGGNVGIGTFNPFGGGLVVLPSQTGNVGIGSLTPGQALDVNGTARMTGFNMNVGSSLNGKVLTSDANGNGSWATGGGSSGWTITNTNDVYETGRWQCGYRHNHHQCRCSIERHERQCRHWHMGAGKAV